MAEGEFALTRQHLEAALQKSEVMGAAAGSDQDLYALLVDAAAQQREQALLQKYGARAEETARLVEHKLHTAVADRAWGVLHTLESEFDQAEERFQRALETFSAYPAPWQVGRTLFDMGELAEAEGKTARAREYYTRALNAFEDLRAAPYAERTRQALSNLKDS
jgi:tetratricopeptide (TPR) repeat protein